MSVLAVDIALFVVYVTTSSFGLLLLKRSLSRMRDADVALLSFSPESLLLLAGAALYVVSFAVWLRILARLPLSTAYPVAIGLTMAFSTTAAVLLLGERIGPLKLGAMLAILGGCIVLVLDTK
jgi:multidrug transporter EmrE-like cation transporter